MQSGSIYGIISEHKMSVCYLHAFYFSFSGNLSRFKLCKFSIQLFVEELPDPSHVCC